MTGKNPFVGKAAGGSTCTLDPYETRRALEVLVSPDHTVELRGLPAGISRVRMGSDLDGLVEAADYLTREGCSGIYWTLNPLSLEPNCDRAAKVGDVVRRWWLLIDLDRVKTKENKEDNATDEEKAGAVALAGKVRDWLDARGWPLPVEVDSGNGWHLLYRIDLPNDEESRVLLRKVLHRLADVHDNEHATVDRSVHNSSRMSKLPGTWAKKGPRTAQRPWRQARLACVPGHGVEVVSVELLRKVIEEEASAPEPELNGHAPDTDNPFVGKAERNKNRLHLYARAALQRELGILIQTPEGGPGQEGRNTQLNKSAFVLGQLVAAGWISEIEVFQALQNTAERIGLTDAEIPRTIRSGLDAGKLNPRKDPEPDTTFNMPGAESVEDDGLTTATFADVAKYMAELSWLWPEWLQKGVLAAMASEPGCGKTRTCLDLIRRIRNGLPWPDGQPMELPGDAPIIYLPSDHQHAEIMSACHSFSIDPASVLLNAPTSDPFGGIDLDDQTIMTRLEERVARIKPVLVIVDTIGNATGRNLCRAEEARMLFVPLMYIALKHKTTVLLATHLNSSGGTLGKRLDGSARQVIKMEYPDPDGQPNRRRLWIAKSNSKHPAPLGVTMGDNGNEYDSNPPSRPDSEPGSGGSKINPVVDWLRERLKGKFARVTIIRTEAELKGYTAPRLYRAKDFLGVEEFTPAGEKGKWWRLADDGQ